jgi:hypothetical protein
MSERRFVLVSLAVIIGIAATLRIWGIRFGLPYAYHVDEPAYVSAALNLGAGAIGRQPNPTGFSNILFLQYATYFVLGRLTNIFASITEFEQAYRADPSFFLLLGRLTSTILGTLNVLVIYLLGKEVKSRTVGVLAAFILSIAFLHVRDSHYAVPDVALAFFISLAVFFSVLALQNEKHKFLYLASTSAGFAIATKWTAWPTFIPIILAFFFYRRLYFQASNSLVFRWILISLVSLAGGFVIGGFQLLMQPITYYNYAIRELRSGSSGGFGIWQIDTLPGYLFYLKTLLFGLGFALLIFAVIGFFRRLVAVVAHKDWPSVLVLSFPLPYFLIMGSTRHYFARYALPLIPFLALFAAETIAATVSMVRFQSRRWRWALFTLLVMVIAAQSLAYSIRHDILLTRQDTRTSAKQWIEAQLPAGTKIALDWPIHGPPLSTLEKSIPNSKKTFDVYIVEGTGLADHSVDWYREQGYEYLISSSFIYDIPLVFPQQDAMRREFYASLDRELELIQEFRPNTSDHELPFIFDEIYGPMVGLWQRDRPGPIIKIYNLGESEQASAQVDNHLVSDSPY